MKLHEFGPGAGIGVGQTLKRFFNKTEFKKGNDRVEVDYKHVAHWYQHGNEIATWDGATLMITNAGWFSVTTKFRLNEILSAARSIAYREGINVPIPRIGSYTEPGTTEAYRHRDLSIEIDPDEVTVGIEGGKNSSGSVTVPLKTNGIQKFQTIIDYTTRSTGWSVRGFVAAVASLSKYKKSLFNQMQRDYQEAMTAIIDIMYAAADEGDFDTMSDWQGESVIREGLDDEKRSQISQAIRPIGFANAHTNRWEKRYSFTIRVKFSPTWGFVYPGQEAVPYEDGKEFHLHKVGDEGDHETMSDWKGE